jgi:asparagine synthase (glutamine-hydrolysing)
MPGRHGRERSIHENGSVSGILAVITAAPGVPVAPRLEPVMAALARRGDEYAELRTWGSCTFGVSRFSWELENAFSGPVLTATDGSIAVAADATLFYKPDLRRRLAGSGIRPSSDAPAHLILAAYRAWGSACVDYLEGDFAFVAWDMNSRTLFAACDFVGKRPLFHAMVDDTLVVASSVRAVLAYPGCPDDLNLVAITEDAALLTGSPTETSYRAVSRLPPGWSLGFRPGDSRPRSGRYWTPPVFADTGRSDFETGAEELRELLTAAVTERLGSSGATAISLSGGYDSPALFAVGSAALASESSPRTLRPVSVSYPPGDPGREDERIEEIVARWGCSAEWVDSATEPLVEDLSSEAAERDGAFVHPFQRIIRRTMRATRALGARVMLDGAGGDFLFQVSSRYYADLFRAGSWRELAREWRVDGGGTVRDFFRSAVLPVLPPGTIATLGRLRGRTVHPPGFSRRVPWWFEPGFVKRSALQERELAHQPPRDGLGMAAYESSWYLTAQPFSRLAAALGDVAVREGVEGRSPFMDVRLIRFAASRPRWERRSDGEVKRLLRASVVGVLPDDVLKPRPVKTGTIGRYFAEGFLHLLDTVEPGIEAPALARAGIVDPVALQDACRRFRETGSVPLASGLFSTFAADAWLRARCGVQASGSSAAWRELETPAA